jgi:hypothetical protein
MCHINRKHRNVSALDVNRSQPANTNFYLKCPHVQYSKIFYNIQGLSKHLHSQHKNYQNNPNHSEIINLLLQAQQALLNCLPEQDLYSANNTAFLQQRSMVTNQNTRATQVTTKLIPLT